MQSPYHLSSSCKLSPPQIVQYPRRLHNSLSSFKVFHSLSLFGLFSAIGFPNGSEDNKLFHSIPLIERSGGISQCENEICKIEFVGKWTAWVSHPRFATIVATSFLFLLAHCSYFVVGLARGLSFSYVNIEDNTLVTQARSADSVHQYSSTKSALRGSFLVSLIVTGVAKH